MSRLRVPRSLSAPLSLGLSIALVGASLTTVAIRDVASAPQAQATERISQQSGFNARAWTVTPTPAFSGSFPVSTYQVSSTPAGGSCLVSVTSCEVDGVSNGTAYTFTVRALNGAGWSPWSAASAAVTPAAPVTPSIVITGSRGEVRGRPGIVVAGSSTLDAGAVVRPWVRFPGQTAYAEGSAQVLVDNAGAFTWE